MAVGKGTVTLTGVCNDTDVTTDMRLLNPCVQDRCLTLYPSLRQTAGTVTAHHRNIDPGSWGATPSHRRHMWKGTYLDPRTKSITNNSSSTWSTRIENARNSTNDCGVEGIMCGRADAGTNVTFTGTIKAFGSGNAAFAPCDIDVIGWQSGYFNGALTILSNTSFYGSWMDYPVNHQFTVPANRTYLTVVMRQYCFGPNHQPPGSGEAPIGTVYHTYFEGMRVKLA